MMYEYLDSLNKIICLYEKTCMIHKCLFLTRKRQETINNTTKLTNPGNTQHIQSTKVIIVVRGKSQTDN